MHKPIGCLEDAVRRVLAAEDNNKGNTDGELVRS